MASIYNSLFSQTTVFLLLLPSLPMVIKNTNKTKKIFMLLLMKLFMHESPKQ